MKTLNTLKLKAVLQQHKLVKIVTDLTRKDFGPSQLIEIKEAKTEGGMKLYRIQVGGGSSLIVGTYGDV